MRMIMISFAGTAPRNVARSKRAQVISAKAGPSKKGSQAGKTAKQAAPDTNTVAIGTKTIELFTGSALNSNPILQNLNVALRLGSQLSMKQVEKADRRDVLRLKVLVSGFEKDTVDIVLKKTVRGKMENCLQVLKAEYQRHLSKPALEPGKSSSK